MFGDKIYVCISYLFMYILVVMYTCVCVCGGGSFFVCVLCILSFKLIYFSLIYLFIVVHLSLPNLWIIFCFFFLFSVVYQFSHFLIYSCILFRPKLNFIYVFIHFLQAPYTHSLTHSPRHIFSSISSINNHLNFLCHSYNKKKSLTAMILYSADLSWTLHPLMHLIQQCSIHRATFSMLHIFVTILEASHSVFCFLQIMSFVAFPITVF